MDSIPRKPSNSGYLRTTITTPADIKRRMGNFPDVNWSALASRAFEEALEILEAPKGKVKK